MKGEGPPQCMVALSSMNLDFEKMKMVCGFTNSNYATGSCYQLFSSKKSHNSLNEDEIMNVCSSIQGLDQVNCLSLSIERWKLNPFEAVDFCSTSSLSLSTQFYPNLKLCLNYLSISSFKKRLRDFGNLGRFCDSFFGNGVEGDLVTLELGADDGNTINSCISSTSSKLTPDEKLGLCALLPTSTGPAECYQALKNKRNLLQSKKDKISEKDPLIDFCSSSPHSQGLFLYIFFSFCC